MRSEGALIGNDISHAHTTRPTLLSPLGVNPPPPFYSSPPRNPPPSPPPPPPVVTMGLGDNIKDAANNAADAVKNATGTNDKTRTPGEVATDAKDKVGDTAEDASRAVRDASKDAKRST